MTLIITNLIHVHRAWDFAAYAQFTIFYYVQPMGGRLFKLAAHRRHGFFFVAQSTPVLRVCLFVHLKLTSYLTDLCGWIATVGAKKKFPYSTVLLPYLTVLLPFLNRTYALLPAYLCRTLIVLLPHPLTYFNRTTSVLSPYRDTTIIDW